MCFPDVCAHAFEAFTGFLLDPLQFAYQAICSVDGVNLGQHFLQHHLDYPGLYTRMWTLVQPSMPSNQAFNTKNPLPVGRFPEQSGLRRGSLGLISPYVGLLQLQEQKKDG